MNRKLMAALRALAGQRHDNNTAYLSTKISAEADAVLLALAADLAQGGGNPAVKRSAAARMLIQRGAQAMLADAEVQA